MGRRTILLVFALVVAALGTFAVFLYADRANDRALEKQDPVEVLVAKSLVRAGTTAAEAERAGSFKVETLPRSAVVAGALRDVASISDLAAVGDIFPGEQILAAKFSKVGSTGALPIPEGRLAMSVQLGDPQRVAGFVQPGSDVALFLTIKPDQIPGQTTPQLEYTRVLLPRVTVLAVGPTTVRAADEEADQNTEAVPTAILTLAVNQAQAQKLVYATSKGQLYLGLLTKDSKVAVGGATDVRNLFA